MDEKQQRQLEQLKDFSNLVQATAKLTDTPETSLEDKYARELQKNKLLDLATELTYSYPKDAHDIWKQHMPENEPPPPILQKAYARLSDEQKAATEGVLQASADQDARSSNLHKILFRAIERMEAKYPQKSAMAGFSEEEAQGAFYIEIRNVFAEGDFPMNAPAKQMPSLEDALALTKFISRHNDPAQRAELERLARAHQQKTERMSAASQSDERTEFQREDRLAKLAGKTVPLESLYLVRVQDGLENAKVIDRKLILTRHNDSRNTFHFSINSVVENHAYGKFDGDTVIISPLTSAFQGGQLPSGFGTADTWINADVNRSIQLAGPILIVPADAVVPEGAEVIRYERGTTDTETRASRDQAVYTLFKERNAEFHKIGFDGWLGRDVSQDEYRALLSDLVGPIGAQKVFLGRHANSPDGIIEDALAMTRALEKRLAEGEKLWANQTGAEYPIDERIAELRRNALQELTAAIAQSSASAATGYYKQQMQQIVARDPSMHTPSPLDTAMPTSLPNDPSKQFSGELVDQNSPANKIPLSSQEQTSFEFANTVEPEPVQRSNFANLAELIEHVTPLAKDDQLMAAPRDTVLYLDGETNALTLATLSETAASDLSNEMGSNGTDTEYAGNRIKFRTNDFEQVSSTLAKLKLEDKDRNTLRAVVRQILNKRIPDISDTTMQRAREMRQARLIELAKLAQKEAATTTQRPSAAPRSAGNDVGNAEAVPDADTVKTVPPQVDRAYVRIPDRKGDRFYLNNRLDTVAFVDKGAKLETKNDNEKTALDMVSIADARGWETIKVSGTEEFRRQVWLEASARGITVRGYKPNEMDRGLLAKRTDQLEKNAPNSIEQADERARPAASENGKEASASKIPLEVTATVATPTFTNAKVANNLSGVLLEHGKAPFEFNTDNKPNYYVKYRDDQGTERITWGLDLERAITKSEAKNGDRIGLENLGRKLVEVEANVKDESGKVVGTKIITTHRNSWNVEVARDFLEMPAQEFVVKHPSQVNAAIINAFTSKAIAEHPKFDALSATDKERLRSGVESKIVEAIVDGKSLPPLSIVKRTRGTEVSAEMAPETSRSR